VGDSLGARVEKGARAYGWAWLGTVSEDHYLLIRKHREESARDLYHYGRALAGSGDVAAARQVWGLGLRCPDDAANWPWKPRIGDELRAATEGGRR